jgi:TonB family protein
MALFFAGNRSSATQQKPERANHTTENQTIQTNQGNAHEAVDVLTDTKGVDLHSYLDEVQHSIKASWFKQIPAAARPPIMKKGRVAISFRVLREGRIANVQYSESSGHIALDRAAYGAVIDSNPLPRLPSEFKCQFLDLRFRFFYNPGKSDLPAQGSSPLVPCVTSTISLVGAVGITVSPKSAQVAAGATQQFFGAVTGDLHSAVNWNVGGPGCTASACGVISTGGLYTAPLMIPNPATIIVTATATDNPTETASATLTVVQSSPSR